MEDLTRTNPTEEGSPSSSLSSGEDARFAPGRVLAERYRIVGRLGQGGMGDVFRADDLKLGTSVALKFLPEGLSADPERLARLHHEVRTARQIAHSNICRVYDIVEADGMQFISMEYIDGEDLASLLRRIGRLSGDKTIDLMRQLCMGVAAAHEAGILHRDLKPANIMIDGRGRIRITDFGLAGFSNQFTGREARAGTPAYMAPEQFERGEVSVQSDLYALGLVLYEMVTGKRTFSGDTVEDYRRLHKLETPTSPSSVTAEVDPAVERAILQCLEKDPTLRPGSAIAVAAALPGADPLAAALAAGEMPSPELVAAAGSSSGMRPSVAFSALIWCVVSILSFVVVAAPYRLHERVSLVQHPVVLQDTARKLAAAWGGSERPAAESGQFASRGDWVSLRVAQQQALAKAGRVEDARRAWDEAGDARTAAVVYSYRQSPRPMLPSDWSQRVSFDDPPRTVPGMVSLWLDTEGRLRYFHAVPPQRPQPLADSEDDSPGKNITWTDCFAAADLDISLFSEVPPDWTPPSFCDERIAWEGPDPRDAERIIRIEAGRYLDRLIYFEIFADWQMQAAAAAEPQTAADRAAMIVNTTMLILVAIGTLTALVMAYRNLKLGRGDQRGAGRFAVYLVIIQFMLWLLTGQHSLESVELLAAGTALSRALLFAIAMWLAYVAIEPFVRRRWPSTLISWTRLLSGKYGDPLVARDVLLGASFGLAIVWAFLIPQFESIQAPLTGDRGEQFRMLLGPRYWLGGLFHVQLSPILISLVFLVLIFVLRRAIELLLLLVWPSKAGAAERLAVITFIVLLSLVNISANWEDELWFSMIGSITIYILWFTVLLRFGVLCLIVMNGFLGMMLIYPLTPNLAAWYSGSTIFAVGVMFAVIGYAFYKSLAGQPLFQPSTLEQ